MKQFLISIFTIFSLTNAFSSEPASTSFYTNATSFQLDKSLPEVFTKTTAAQIITDFSEKYISLVFFMGTSDIVEVSFDLKSDTTDKCGNRHLIAGPVNSPTPHANDFQIEVTDYTKNTCNNLKIPSPVFATFTTFEVDHNVKTTSFLKADGFLPSPKEAE